LNFPKVAAPVIMMSRNRLDSKDRVRGELDFEVNRRAASDIQSLARGLALLDEKIDDLGSMIRTPKSQ
jgi:CRP/FNR family transcriptional regulator, cyclic AMP receptor protein